jgi:hypothetical protein
LECHFRDFGIGQIRRKIVQPPDAGDIRNGFYVKGKSRCHI